MSKGLRSGVTRVFLDDGECFPQRSTPCRSMSTVVTVYEIGNVPVLARGWPFADQAREGMSGS
jgi:hypothetical protein